AKEAEPSLRPTLTLISVPAKESRKFCACAGPCEDQPITPICRMPANALGSSGKRCRPPRTIYSSVSARRIFSFSNIFVVQFKLMTYFSCTRMWRQMPSQGRGGGQAPEAPTDADELQ